MVGTNKPRLCRRNKIVDHEGNKELKVECTGTLHTADYQRMIRDHLLGNIMKAEHQVARARRLVPPGFLDDDQAERGGRGDDGDGEHPRVVRDEDGDRLRHSLGDPQEIVGDLKLGREKIERLLEFEVDGNPDGNVMETWVGYLRRVCDGFVETVEHPGSPETLEI